MDQPGPGKPFSGFPAACRRTGPKLTPRRPEIYRALAASTGHPSAEALHRRLIGIIPARSPDRVYRTLATFGVQGLLKGARWE